MTSPIPPTSRAGSNSLVASGSDVLGKEDFLQLLVTQLRYQDPLNPLDGTQFASQLAEFSGLEQLIALNDGLDAVSQGNAVSRLTTSADLGASLIGHTILGFGDQFEVTGGGQQTVVADVAPGGGFAQIEIFDAQGNPVATRQIGGIPGGPQQEISFDLSGVPNGQYHYRLTVTDTNGNPVPVEQYVRGTVRGVFFNSEGVVLRVGSSMRVTLDNLAEIEPS